MLDQSGRSIGVQIDAQKVDAKMNGPKIKNWTVQKATPGLCDGIKLEGFVGERLSLKVEK